MSYIPLPLIAYVKSTDIFKDHACLTECSVLIILFFNGAVMRTDL